MIEIEGLIINVEKYKDYDLIVQIVSEEGIISALNRGALRPKAKLNFANYILSNGKIELYKGGQSYYKIKNINPNFDIKKSFSDINAMFSYDFIRELTKKMNFENIFVKNLYKVLLNTVVSIDNKEFIFFQDLRYFYFLLDSNGVFPSLHLDDTLYFSFDKSVFVHNVEKNENYCILDKRVVSTLQNIIEIRPCEIDVFTFKEVFNYFTIIASSFLSVELNSKKLLTII